MWRMLPYGGLHIVMFPLSKCQKLAEELLHL